MAKNVTFSHLIRACQDVTLPRTREMLWLVAEVAAGESTNTGEFTKGWKICDYYKKDCVRLFSEIILILE